MAAAMPAAVQQIGAVQGIGRKDRDTLCREAAAQFDALEALLARGDYLVGEALSVADIGVAAMCTVLEYAAEAAELMRARPRLMAWRDRIDAATFPPGIPAVERATR
jgi:glutathione S-transferase